MSNIDNTKISTRNIITKKPIDDKNKAVKAKKKNLLFNTMNRIDCEKYNFKTKKVSRGGKHFSRSSSVIIQKPKNSASKNKAYNSNNNMNIKGSVFKKYSNKTKKISYNKSCTDLHKNNKKNIFNSSNTNTIEVNKRMKKCNREIEHETINYIINTFNLSSKNIDPVLHKNKSKDFNGIVKSINNNNKAININNTINPKNHIKIEELKKENEKLIKIFNDKINDNKNYRNKITDLENKNSILSKKTSKLKKENEKYSKILGKVLKLLQILKQNGLDVEEILENLSSTEDDDEDVDNNSCSGNLSSIHSKNSSRNYSVNHSKNINIDSIETEHMKSNEIFRGSKMTLKENSIPKLDMNKIYANKGNHSVTNKKKYKNISHSVEK